MAPTWTTPHLAELERLSSELSGTELQSLLLEVMRRRAQARTTSEVLSQYEQDLFCAPGLVDQRTSTALDGHLLAAADAFEAIELAPIAPLGTCSTVALTDQHRVLSALRRMEVVSDPTNVMALECARRLRARPDVPVHLTTCQRVLRTQPVPDLPAHSQHFRIFALASGGREAQEHAFTVQTLLLHIRSMLCALERLEQHGYSFGAQHVALLCTPERQQVAERVGRELQMDVRLGPLEHAYYSGGVRYQIWVTPPTEAEALPLIDGGSFDWLTKLAHNRRLVFIASGAGAQLIPLRFALNSN